MTLNDVASLANVSPQTVSRAIRNPELVSERTVTRVQWAISTTGYVPNLAASNLASNRSKTIAAIIPTISASVFADALHGLDAVLTPHGYQLFIGATDYSIDREEELIRAFMGRRPDGLFIVGTKHTPAATLLLRKSRIPIVEAWNWTDEPIDNLVGFSNSDAIEAIVEYVVSKGYKHPTFAASLQPGDSRALDRQESFARTVARLLPGEPPRVVDSGTGVIDMDAGVRLLDIALKRHPETDVLMFASDIFAAGALLECRRRGISVPGDLAITGFGDFEISRHLLPTLTTVAVPNVEIGTRAGELLIARMSGIGEESEMVDLGFSVVARESA
ncbi:LacI family DNA-binding transcriptional regulator [Lacisediminihabitans profunda]|uniref:LacI family DNA-binding transcriptional regulator n=1 Tax=Lacisediminihabitans profunda TaxID=2594790 RepID=A0A5C8UK60_9MICO|nr:LacI family DNA-binding transcriptional regulator [Lacisediminihabitans profunda]TXN28742.1 LacI family DNA-binding transcriptional regulator [Lacisediminihabitans profunda]